ncbi:MAG: TIGR03087 family PEP-CTERM/XrtA system glycosyltransferase [Planctomycetes bacterium]|nr:TIGR03087 family PEP-CTERM/XrtA system glycosyltransferase [Planctomycetota bacterium]
MNILFLAHRIPYPPNKGDKLRSFHMLEHLASRHSVWCAAFVDDDRDWRHLDRLQARCEKVHLVPLKRRRSLCRGAIRLLGGGTITEGCYYRSNGDMARCLSQWSQQVRFDAVLAFSSSMARYGLAVDAPRRVLDLCDLDSAKWMEYAAHAFGPIKSLYRLESHRLGVCEAEWIRAYDAATLITEHEVDSLPYAELRDRITIVGNGVHVSPDVKNTRDHASPIVGFIGAMDYRPNVDAVQWFADRIWPQIRAAVPQARFRIVGRNPNRQVRRLDRRPGIDVVGEVADVGPECRAFSVSVAPLRIARGLQNKVLEAMAVGTAVVLTSKAAAGVSVVDGVHCRMADDAESFADRTIELLTDRAMADRLGRHARKFVTRNHCWSTEMTRLEQLLTGQSVSSGDTAQECESSITTTGVDAQATAGAP